MSSFEIGFSFSSFETSLSRLVVISFLMLSSTWFPYLQASAAGDELFVVSAILFAVAPKNRFAEEEWRRNFLADPTGGCLIRAVVAAPTPLEDCPAADSMARRSTPTLLAVVGVIFFRMCVGCCIAIVGQQNNALWQECSLQNNAKNVINIYAAALPIGIEVFYCFIQSTKW